MIPCASQRRICGKGQQINGKVPSSRHPARRRRAFTLIELLVVIAIISLLVSILLPSLTKAKDLARCSLCLSQYHQIGIGMQMYSVDNFEFIPQPILMENGYDKATWASLLQIYHYIDNGVVFEDPGCMEKETDPHWGHLIGGYGMNPYWIDGPYANNKQYPPSMVQIPSEEVVCCDNRGMWGVGPLLDDLEKYDINTFPAFWGGGNPLEAERCRMSTRHMGSPNVLFLDWHAEHITVEKAVEWTDFWLLHGYWPTPYCWAPNLN